MKFHTEYLTFHTKKHREYIHLTPQVEAIVKKSGIKEGMVLVSAMHITAGVYVNDNESGLIADIDEWLEHLAPYRKGDRKSTRLNSSHANTSYAVFCLKKKNKM